MIRLRVIVQCALLYLYSILYLYLYKKQEYLKKYSPILQFMTSIYFPVNYFNLILRSACIEVLLCTDIG